MWHISADELVAPAPCLHDQWLRAFPLNVVGPSRHRGFLCVFSLYYTIHRSLWHLHCLDNVRYCSPRCFHPNDLPSMADGTFTHDEVNLTGHKKLTFMVSKVVLVSTLLFKDYLVNFTHFCQICNQVYTHHIDNFSGSHSMSNTMRNKFGKFCKNFFPGVYMAIFYQVFNWLVTGRLLCSH